MTHLFGQPAQTQEIESRKAKAVEELEEILKRIAISRHEAMVDDKITIIPHPRDFQIPNSTNTPIQLLRIGVLQEGDSTYDIIAYRLQLGQQAAFGLHNGEYIDPRKHAVVCITMRPMRFVEIMVGAETGEQLEARFTALNQIIAMLNAIFPPTD